MQASKVFFFTLFLAFGRTADASVYWARPSGTHNISGQESFCSTIRSGNPNTPSSAYGTIGAAAACAKLAGDIVNIRGDSGPYPNSPQHRFRTDNPDITPSYALASGTSEANRTMIQGAPMDPRPTLNIPGWFRTDVDGSRRDVTLRNYVSIRYLEINGAGGSLDVGVGAEIMAEGAYITIDDVIIRNSFGSAVSAFHNDCLRGHHLTVRNSIIGPTGLRRSLPNPPNGYGMYINSCDVLVENTEFFDNWGGALQIYNSISSNSVFSHRPIIRNNLIRDTKTSVGRASPSCFGIVVDGDDALIHHNIIDMRACDPSIGSTGIIAGYGNPNGRARIFHNLIIGTSRAAVKVGQFGATTGNKIKNNILLPLSPATAAIDVLNGSTAEIAGNRTQGRLTDCTVSTTDFRHRNGSSCVNTGVAISGFSAVGNPDQGPFEAGTYESARIDGATLTVKFRLGVAPIQMKTVPTGFQVGCSGPGCGSPSIASVARSSNDSETVQLGLAGLVDCSCNPNQTWTVSYDGSNLTDGRFIGPPSAQRAQTIFSFGAQTVSALCTQQRNCSKPMPPTHFDVR